jgi:hypothetical protein
MPAPVPFALILAPSAMPSGAIAAALLLAIAVLCCYLWSLQRAFAAIPAQHRRLQPWMVWLTVLPYVSGPWHLILVLALEASLARDLGLEYRRSGAGVRRLLGVVASLGMMVSSVINADVLLLGCFVIWMAYWVSIELISRRLRLRARMAPAPAGPIG